MNFLAAIQKSIQSYTDGVSFENLDEVTEGGLKYDRSYFDDLEKEMILTEGELSEIEKKALADKSKSEKSVFADMSDDDDDGSDPKGTGFLEDIGLDYDDDDDYTYDQKVVL